MLPIGNRLVMSIPCHALVQLPNEVLAGIPKRVLRSIVYNLTTLDGLSTNGAHHTKLKISPNC